MTDALYEGLIRIDVASNAPEQMEIIAALIQEKMAEINGLSPGELGPKLFGGVAEGAQVTTTAIERLGQALAGLAAIPYGERDASVKAEILSTNKLLESVEVLHVAMMQYELGAKQAAAAVVTGAEAQSAALTGVAQKQAVINAERGAGSVEASVAASVAANVNGVGAGRLAGVGDSELRMHLGGELALAEDEIKQLTVQLATLKEGGRTAVRVQGDIEKLNLRRMVLTSLENQELERLAEADAKAFLEREAALGPQPITRKLGLDTTGPSEVEGYNTEQALARVTPEADNMSLLKAAQLDLVGATNQLTVVRSKAAAGGDAGYESQSAQEVAITRAESGVIRANVRLMGAIEKAALDQLDYSVIDRSTTARVQKAQTALIESTERLAVINTGIAAEGTTIAGELQRVRGAELVGARAMNEAQIKVVTATEQLSAAREAEAKAASAESGGGGLGIGSGFKYFAMFAAFGVGLKLLGDMKKQTEDYSLAVNQLSISMGTNYDAADKLAQGYAAIGQSMATAPSVAINAATQFGRIFSDQSGASQAIGASLGGQVNLLEGAKEVPKAQADLGAIALNYGLDAQGAKDLYGSATYIAQQTGSAKAGALLSGTAGLSDLTKQEGFTPQQALAMLGVVSERSGASPDTAAADLKRVLGRTGANTFTGLLSEYGITAANTPGGMAAEFAKLSPALKALPEGSAGEATAITTLGGGRSGAAFLNMIQNFSQIQDIAGKGAAPAGVKSAEDQANDRLRTFSGLMTQITTDFANLAVDLGKSGIGGALGLIVLGVDKFVVALDDLIKGLNSLPGVVQAAVAGLGVAVLAALKPEALISGANAATSVLNKVNPLASSGAAASAAPLTGVAANTAAIEAHTAALLGETQAEAAVVAATAPEVVATNAITLAKAEYTTAVALQTEAEGALDLLRKSGVATAEALVTAEGEVDLASATTATALTGLATAIAAGVPAATTDAAAQVALAVTEGGGAVAGVGALIASLVGLGLAAAAVVLPLAAIVGSILLIKDQQDKSNAAADTKTAASKATAAAQSDPTQTSLERAVFAQEAAIKAAKAAGYSDQQYATGLASGDIRADDTTQADKNKKIADMQAKVNALNAQLAAVNAARTTATASSSGSDFFGAGYNDPSGGIAQLETSRLNAHDASKQILALIANTKSSDNIKLGAELTPQTGQNGLIKEITRQISLIGQEANPSAQLSDLKDLQTAVLAALAKAKANGGVGVIGGAQDLVDQVNKKYYETIVTTANQRIASIKALEGDTASADAHIHSLLTADLQTTARGGDVSATIALIHLMTLAEFNAFNAAAAADLAVQQGLTAHLADVFNAAKAAASAANDGAALILAQSNASLNQALGFDQTYQYGVSLAPHVASAAETKAAADLAANKAQIAALTTQKATIDASTPYAAPTGTAYKEPKDPKGPKGPSAASLANQADLTEEARIAAQGIAGDPLSAALTNLQVAEYKMHEPGTIGAEYWKALKSLHDAQYALATAQQTSANDAIQLGLDLTNPLIVAQEKVREAARQLIFDVNRGALSDVTNKDRLALKQAQSSAEKTAFDQKFSDESTNYNLQRISLSAYLSYLNAQHNYLTHVHNKTRQQVDELNQVDQALQGLASQLQGQFNLGSIKLPTAYQARAISAASSTVQITINGADLVAVKGVLTQYVGQAAMATAGTTVRKV